MKYVFYLITMCLSNLINAQALKNGDNDTFLMNGKVINEKNVAVPYATISLKNSSSTVVADTLGNFRINAKRGDTLIITSVGYTNCFFAVASFNNISIILKSAAKMLDDIKVKNKTNDGLRQSTSELTTIEQQYISNTLEDYVKNNGASGGISHGSPLPYLHLVDATKGNRYLFDSWVNGKVINSQGAVINTDSSVFNYDKIMGKLLATKDKKTIIEVDDNDIQRFILNDGQFDLIFEKVKVGKDMKFLQILASLDEKFVLYKMINTNFQRNNYSNTGLIENGHNYDLYLDKSTYYIKKTSENQVSEIEMKRKTIQGYFKENPKTTAYFALHKNDTVDESFLIKFLEFLYN